MGNGMRRCERCGEMLLVEHHSELGTDRPAGEENPTLVARCPNPACPSNQGSPDRRFDRGR